MKSICLQIPKNKKYILACSFGPDSMALLDVAIKQKLDIVVAHVNYRHREESIFEEKELRKYCKKHNIKIEILDLLKIKPEGNFEAWARNIRYEFFSKVLEKNNADAVLVAHHQDDLIETYLLQKKRGSFVKNWGISKITKINGTKIIRPLLKFSKKDLLDYCNENKIPFSIDKTNLTNEYERNKIRHEVVEKLSDSERKNLLAKISQEKITKIKFKNKWTVAEFLKLSYEQTLVLLDHYLEKQNEHKNLSKKHIEEIKKALTSKKSNVEIKISSSIMLSRSYNKLYLVDLNKLKTYKLKLANPCSKKTEFLAVNFSKNSKDRNIFPRDYPIIIRNAQEKDKYCVKNYQCSIKRLFIDWKVPLFLRKVWPVVENKDKKIIYIPRYREKFIDNHETKFEINTEYFLVQ